MKRLLIVLSLLLVPVAAEATCFLKQSTAVDLKIGPFLDQADGNTVEGGLTITQPDVRLSKVGGAFAQKSAAQTLTHDENGWYGVNLSTTDTDTLGSLIIVVHESGALQVWKECVVLPANSYDGLIAGTGVGVRADVQGSGGTAGAHLEPTVVSGSGIIKDSTGVILTLPIKSGLTGAPMTGIAFNSATLVGEYCFATQAGACTGITLTGTCSLGTWTSGCFLEKDTTAGQYELHVPNAAFAAGNDRVTVTLTGVTGMAPTIVLLDLVDVGMSVLHDDTQDIIADVASVQADTDALQTDSATILSNTNSILADTGTDGVVVASASKSPVGTYRKNVGSQRGHPIYMRAVAGVQSGLTSATVTVTVSKDSAAFVATSGSVAEVASGVYMFSPSQADTNCDTCVYLATATGGVPYIFYIFPAP